MYFILTGVLFITIIWFISSFAFARVGGVVKKGMNSIKSSLKK